jgi:pilus assembly protein CpaF
MLQLNQLPERKTRKPMTEQNDPTFLPGSRASLAALIEQVEIEFLAETEGRADLLGGDETTRKALINDVMEYLLATESIMLSRPERMTLVETVFRDLFEFGPLAPYLNQADVREITIRGADQVHIRLTSGLSQHPDIHFRDDLHLELLVQRTFFAAGLAWEGRDSMVEFGTTLAGRPARLIVTGPPVSPTLYVEIRLRPPQSTPLDALVEPRAAEILHEILKNKHGLLIVGDAVTGKTTLLESLLPLLPPNSRIIERADELRVPDAMRDNAPNSTHKTVAIPPLTFADAITAALPELDRGDGSAYLVLDEVRFDESAAMWAALNSSARQLWTFRGSTDAFRLRTAFSMAVRRAEATLDQAVINDTLRGKLPFVAFMSRQQGQPKLTRIAEFPRDEAGTMDLTTIYPREGELPGSRLWLCG